MLDPFVLLAPILLLPVVALLRFLGCYSSPPVVDNPHPLILVNCGGPAISDATGNWQDDTVTGGDTGDRFTSMGGNSFTKTDPTVVLDSNGQVASNLYTTCRNGTSFSYIFTVPNPGQYGVTLKFAEISPRPNGRLFNIQISGGVSYQPLTLLDYNISARAGGDFKVYDNLFLVTADSGQTITVTFTTGTEDLPIVNAIEVAY